MSVVLRLPVERCAVVARETRVTAIVRAGGEELRALLRNTGKLLVRKGALEPAGSSSACSSGTRQRSSTRTFR